MKLHTLKTPKGARKNSKRVGRGIGSGSGKTSGRGHKGQKSRSGGSIARGFEGGQMPLARRLPKFGFTNIFREEYAIVNLDTLSRLGLEGEITPEVLVEKGVIRKNRKLKVLGRGEAPKSVTVTASKFSKTAVEKIEKAGGKTQVA
ncbi:MAG: 50S ribosomal protein L15 [Candidatus Nitrospinota bacterium M3_3B_026]